MEQTVRSVLAQTYENWEWIIIDDGSTDNTRDIIHSWKDTRIRYHYQEHGGIDKICLTHNKALGLSKGEFIALIDGDDLWPAYKLEKQCESFSDDAVVLSYGECCLINSDGKTIDYVAIPSGKEISRNDPVGAALRELLPNANSFIYNPTVLIRKSALEGIGGFVVFKGLSHDFTTWCRLSLEGTFAPLPLCLGYWRKHNNSLTFHNAGYRFRNKIEFIKDFAGRFEKEIASPGISLTKNEIYSRVDMRSRSFLDHFSYDRAMLMAKIGMFQDANEEFDIYCRSNPSFKNSIIKLVFSLSDLMQYDLVNPLRRLKEKINLRRL
jgi:glycosyltransferase involved in cell wall biosynthesis